MRRLIFIITAALTLGNAASAQTYDAAKIQKAVKAIASDPALSEAVISICVRTGDGQTLADIDADNMVIPASNMKLITTGAALHKLGPDYRFNTGIGYSGEIAEGVLYGDIFIRGGGDPTLASKDSIAPSLWQTFIQWERMIRDAGISRIEGRIIGDGRHFEGMPDHGTWQWADLGTYYGSGATGLMFYENMHSFAVGPGTQEGDSLTIEMHYPQTPWMQIRKNGKTGKAGTGDRLYLYASDLAPIAEFRGTFAVDKARKRLDCSNKFPEYTCASYFADHLESRGISCSGGPADFRLFPVPDTLKADTILGSTESPSLSRITFETNHASNNLYAEALLKTLGKEMTGCADYDSSCVAVNAILEDLAIDTSYGIRMVDGSGLSRQNYMSADFMCRFLEAMMHSPHFEDFISSLPSPGSNGTLATNMKGQPAELRERIKAKSGSMNGVRCYSGYIIPTQGCKESTLIFSILINNCTSPTWKVRQLSDKIMAALAAAN